MNDFLLTLSQIDPNAIKYYEKIYTPISFGILNQSDDTYLGNKNNKVCRFCGKPEGTANFDKRAHVFPESIGNRHLLSYYECDTCNKKFSRLLENQYGNFFKFYHNASNIRGKKTVPNYQANSGKSKSEWTKDVAGNPIFISADASDSITTFINQSRKEVLRIGKIDPFIPMAVYKCFVKMALSIMPESELNIFEETISWILQKNHENIFGEKLLLCRYKMIPGYGTTKFPAYALYKKRQENNTEVFIPYMLFHLTYGNFSYFVEVPTVKHPVSVGITELPFPPIPFITTDEGLYDFSGTEKVNNATHSIVYSFDSVSRNFDYARGMNVDEFKHSLFLK